MPKLAMTDRQKKNLELQALITGKMIRSGKDRRKVANQILMPYSTFCAKLKDPDRFGRDELLRLFENLKFTDEEKASVW